MKQSWEKESPQVERLNEYKRETNARALTLDEVLDFLRDKNHYVVSVKIDGEENLLQISEGIPKLYSRTGRVRTDFPVTEEIKKLGIEDLIAVGELYVVDEKGSPISYPDAVSTLRTPTPESEQRIRYAVFDILVAGDTVLEDMPYETRVARIYELFSKGKFVQPAVFAVDGVDAVKRLWDEMVQGKGYEGLVITYEENGEEQKLKVKPVFTQDLVVLGVEYSPEHEWMSALILAYIDRNGNYRYAGKVGTGFKLEDRTEWYRFAQTRKVKEEDNIIWLDPTKSRVVEVKSDELRVQDTPLYTFDKEYKLIGKAKSAIGRKPVFVRIREDKKPIESDVRLLQIPGFEKESSLKRISNITPEMEDWFKKRTQRHIDLTKKYCKKIHELAWPHEIDRFEGILERGEVHDQSKFEEPERTPYVYISWQYKCKDDGTPFEVSDEIKEQMDKASEHHVKHNKHHPEYYSNEEIDLINREDRDKPPKELIDAAKMTALDIAEMVADWCAMAEERGNTPKEWADKNVNVRWQFTEPQTKLIYELIDKVWKPMKKEAALDMSKYQSQIDEAAKNLQTIYNSYRKIFGPEKANARFQQELKEQATQVIRDLGLSWTHYLGDFMSAISKKYKELNTEEKHLKQAIEEAGAEWLGITTTDDGPIVWFNDPKTHFTKTLPVSEVTKEKVLERLSCFSLPTLLYVGKCVEEQTQKPIEVGDRIKSLNTSVEGTVVGFASRNETGTDIDIIIHWDEPLLGQFPVSEVHPDEIEFVQKASKKDFKKYWTRLVERYWKTAPEKAQRTAYYPDHPDKIKIQSSFYPEGLSEEAIYNYWKNVQADIMPYLSPFYIMTLVKTDGQLVTRRNDAEGNPISITDDDDYEKWIATGGTLEVHIVLPESETSLAWIDVDPKEKVPFDKVKDITIELYNTLQDLENVKDVRLKYSGGRGFHLLLDLKEPQDVNQIRKILQETLKTYIEEKGDPKLTTGTTADPESIRLDTSTLKYLGTLRAPFSLNALTGLVSLFLTPAELKTFRKEDAIINNFFQRKSSILPWDDEDYIKYSLCWVNKENPEYWMRIAEDKDNVPDKVTLGNVKPGFSGKFFIQEHRTIKRGMVPHFDLRLEWPASLASLEKYIEKRPFETPEPKEFKETSKVLRSWALPKAILPLGSEKVLAIEVEPHPFEYGSFEGTIPEGSYGAGKVKVYDQGTYTVRDVTPNTLTIDLQGDKVKNSYTLIRTRGKNTWLITRPKTEVQ